jgi:hypothetical protein
MKLSRRTVLRGAGVALTLPFMNSLHPRGARAQALVSPVRFIPIYLPNGAPEFWKPGAAGSGSSWQLSSVLQPLEALKPLVTVISGLENGSVFNADGNPSVEPAHGRQSGAWLTCVDADALAGASCVSVDQIVAAQPSYLGAYVIPSLQVGLSTSEDYCDGKPCERLRSVSWKSATEPLYKTVDPRKLFEQLTAADPLSPTPEDLKRRAAHASVLDAVLESAAVVQSRLSAQDKLQLDQFLSSVREVEKKLETIQSVPLGCEWPSEPVFPELTGGGIYNNTADYNKGAHADLINDLVVLALQCDLTRVVSYMLGDEYCQFVYDHVPLRTFTASSSAPAATGVCGEYHGAQHCACDEYATITWWNVGKVAELCAKLASVQDGESGQTLLDNSVVFLGSCMHGSDHRCADLPALMIGGGGGRLRTDQHLALENRPMRDFYSTLMNGIFDMGMTDFGVNRTGAPLEMISELLT